MALESIWYLQLMINDSNATFAVGIIILVHLDLILYFEINFGQTKQILQHGFNGIWTHTPQRVKCVGQFWQNMILCLHSDWKLEQHLKCVILWLENPVLSLPHMVINFEVRQDKACISLYNNNHF